MQLAACCLCQQLQQRLETQEEEENEQEEFYTFHWTRTGTWYYRRCPLPKVIGFPDTLVVSPAAVLISPFRLECARLWRPADSPTDTQR